MSTKVGCDIFEWRENAAKAFNENPIVLQKCRELFLIKFFSSIRGLQMEQKHHKCRFQFEHAFKHIHCRIPSGSNIEQNRNCIPVEGTPPEYYKLLLGFG